ncbi:MAG TPA: histone deacetylase [Flavobacteriaceae bacterium]|nr:histone deacetylase [Flavobacteriaceae bacterium]
MLKIAFHPLYRIPLPERHRFPMEKYELVPQQLLYEGTVEESNYFAPDMVNIEHVLKVHSAEYVQSLLDQTMDRRAARKIGFPMTKTLVERELRLIQGTLSNCEYAMEFGISMNVAGGTHHAYAGHGEGFCLLNDQAVAAQFLLDYWPAIKKILIVDLDVHQGNGTARIFQNESRVFTFSIHGEGNYPFKKEKSDLDIPLPDNTEDEEYLSTLIDILPKLLNDEKPDFIFYLSGVDVLGTDKLGRLNLSIDGCKERDRIVLEMCRNSGIPVQVSLGGGYSPNIKTIVDAHANTFRLAQEIFF